MLCRGEIENAKNQDGCAEWTQLTEWVPQDAMIFTEWGYMSGYEWVIRETLRLAPSYYKIEAAEDEKKKTAAIFVKYSWRNQ